MATRNGSATWQGDLQGGSGRVTVGNGVHEGPYTFKSRFEENGEQGTNPEELIAAAQAACYSMQLSANLANDGHEPEEVTTDVRAVLRNIDGAPTIATLELRTRGRVPGIDQDTFQRYADQAKQDCLITRALAGVKEFDLEATLEG